MLVGTLAGVDLPVRTVVRGRNVVVRLLGPVAVDASAGESVDAGQPRQLCVLAALLADASRVVSQDVLIDRVWGDDPPGSARRVLQYHLSRVRRLVDQVAARHQVPVALRRRPGGYVLEVAPELVDLHQFRRLVAKARGSIHKGQIFG